MSPQPEVLIPGLCDDLALRCLAMLSHGHHGVLECVSRRWKDAVRSSEYTNIKAKEGWCGNWLFALTEEQINTQWIAFDPDADRWHPLPRIPRADYIIEHRGFSCITVHNLFFVIGGQYLSNDSLLQHEFPSVTNDVMQFDPFKKRWKRVSSMRTARSNFACAVVCGKIYVAGGWNSGSERIASAEVYHPLEDRWEDLPEMTMPCKDSCGISYEGQFCVFGGKMEQDHQSITEVFVPSDWKWHAAKDVNPFARTTEFSLTEVGGCLYTISEWQNSIKAKKMDQRDWTVIGSLPPVFLPDHSRPLESFGFGLVGLGKNIYVLGGKVLKFARSAAPRFDIAKLDLVRVCDPRAMPLEWREIRSMRGVRGAVVGCCSLYH
ncbi:F-box/kelch-repeat protein At1g16250 [Aristolochia californica]|uniref:F-box/kelch-repeat protein At1g16250 n=1 Tax=Aristolochia californica TaxID=171875 RepID=UPI0035E12D63